MIKKILGSVREYKKDSILTSVLVTLEVITEVLIPFLMAKLIDFGVNVGDMQYILKMGVALVVFCFISLFFGVAAGRTASKASAGFAANLRKDIFHSVQNFSFTNIDRFSTASLVTRLTTDITNIQNAYQMAIRLAVRAPGMLVFALVMAFSIQPKLSLIFLAIIPILGIGLFLVIKNVHPIFERVFKTYDKLNNMVQENLHGIRVVKSYVQEDQEKKRFGNISERIYKDFVKAENMTVFITPLMMLSIFGALLLLSWFGAHLIVGGEMSTGELMSMFTYTMQILMSLLMVSMVFIMFVISRASAERIVEVLNESSTITNKENPVTEVIDGSIKFENVSFAYSKDADKPCLSDINFEIKSGQTIGILGGTGSGKTSLVQLIPRLYDVPTGRVLVGGVDVRDYDIQVLRNEVAMVLQSNVLFSGTIKENLRWGNENATDEEIQRVCALAQADGFIQAMPDKYDTYIEQGGTNVSGGQKQRLCIARALLKQPKILILDDSTSAVDTRTDALIRKAFREELPNTTKIIIAQRVASVQDADKIIVMDGGKAVAMGTHEELLKTSDIYAEVYTSQMQGGVTSEN